MKTGEIAFSIRNQDRTVRYLLRLTDVETVKMQYEQALGSRALAKELGVDQTIINRLVQEGQLRRKSRRTIDGYNSPKFEADAARRLLREYNMTNTA
jgi:DNA-binding transcriptional regulator LsrR (DeoR family)